MAEQKQQFHGSDLEKVEAVYGIPKEQIIGFGANVNPLGISTHVKRELAAKLDVIASYPDREYGALRAAIASYCGARPDNILVGNGSTELISLFIQCLHPKKAVLLAPTYSEYERELSLCGTPYDYFYLKAEDGFALSLPALEQALADDADLLILCNPNNPTSSLIETGQMHALLRLCLEKRIAVLVDETYVEFTPDIAAATAVSFTEEFPNLAVLRGVSKFFAAPGLRLGYAVTGSRTLLAYIRANQNPWTVNAVADLAGQLMFADTGYIRETRALIQGERHRMCQALRAFAQLKVFEPQANFVLVRIEDTAKNADMLFEAAIRLGMMIRSCESFASLGGQYFRFCIMLPAQNDRLLACISDFLQK